MAADTLKSQLVDLVKKATAQSIETNLPKDVVLGRLAKTQFNTDISIGDSVDFIFPADITLYDGTTLTDVEYPTDNHVNIKINQSKNFRYGISKLRSGQINALPTDKALPLLKEYVNSGSDQFIQAIEDTYASLYPFAGYNLNKFLTPSAPTTPYDISTYPVRLFTKMRAMFKRGIVVKGVKRTAWKDGKMSAYVTPEVEDLLLSDTSRLAQTPAGFDVQAKGYIGTIAGWKIFSSSALPVSTDVKPVHTCMFGIDGETFGTVVQKELDTMHYIPENSFDDVFKGMGVFGADVLRKDKFGAANVTL